MPGLVCDYEEVESGIPTPLQPLLYWATRELELNTPWKGEATEDFAGFLSQGFPFLTPSQLKPMLSFRRRGTAKR